jgi:hypothetical protein
MAALHSDGSVVYHYSASLICKTDATRIFLALLSSEKCEKPQVAKALIWLKAQQAGKIPPVCIFVQGRKRGVCTSASLAEP